MSDRASDDAPAIEAVELITQCYGDIYMEALLAPDGGMGFRVLWMSQAGEFRCSWDGAEALEQFLRFVRERRASRL